jgi:protein SCO1/2
MEFSPRDLRLGLIEASANKIASPIDQLLLFCYRYDPATGKYGLLITNIVRLAESPP